MYKRGKPIKKFVSWHKSLPHKRDFLCGNNEKNSQTYGMLDGRRDFILFKTTLLFLRKLLFDKGSLGFFFFEKGLFRITLNVSMDKKK